MKLVQSSLARLLEERILVLDGAMGTMIQACGLGEADFRGARFGEHPRELRGCNDLLALTQPQLLEEIHGKYLDAGADIIETNTFNSTSIALADYGLEARAFELNRAAADVATRVARGHSARHGGRPCWVAGALGPTNKTASLSPDVERPDLRAVSFRELEHAYHEQVSGLMAGGVDLLLAETGFDTLNLKAALFAIERWFLEQNRRVPVIASFTITDRSGRTLSGQTPEAVWISLAHARPLAIGINCSLGAEEMRPHVEEISRVSTAYVACYPNAGLPNAFGGYDQTPEEMAGLLGEFAREGWLNLVGGCCGTTPEHIRAIAEAVHGLPPRRRPERLARTRLAGLEPLEFRPDSNFILVGERTNVTGSRRFARLIREGDFDGALQVARQQVEGGANLLDVNMDEGLLDSVAAMTRFLHLAGADPEIARLPFMIDSSRFSVLEAGLQCLQGKGVVNSISLKEGEEEFLRQADLIRRHGAAVVVMAFDEAGQAVDAERKVAILGRAWQLLVERVGFDPSDVIFDPNILAIGTGIEEHDGYALAFLEAARELKRRFPLSKISGGVSNISFAFRGNDAVREAMHAAFLYHAIRAGMDMGIVNAGQLAVYDDIPPELLEHVEDVLLARRPDATERLITFAGTIDQAGKARTVSEADGAWRRLELSARLSHALVHGLEEHLHADLDEALTRLPGPLEIIEGPLMAGMNVVGDLFGSGRMFLPQVVKSARVMKRAVAHLQPHMDRQRAAGGGRRHARILMATVKGDVHDIGKNIVGVVLACNGYEIIDLGVMVHAEKILEAARQHQVQAIGLSGLITPSLDEMVHVAEQLERSQLRVPLLIGGATTSRRHSAVRIAPRYSGLTVHVPDASRAVEVVGSLLHPELGGGFAARTRAEQQAARTAFDEREREPLLAYEEARRRRLQLDWAGFQPAAPPFSGVRALSAIPLESLEPYIDWTPFFHVWELRGVFPRILEDVRFGAAARELYEQARALLATIVRDRLLEARAVYGFFPASSEGDDIVLWSDEARRAVGRRWPTLRQQRSDGASGSRLALADFVAPTNSGCNDWIGAFAVTAGHGLEALVRRFDAELDDYQSIMAKALADRLAEACAEMLHQQVRHAWYAPDEALAPEQLHGERYRGIRPAPGYPACPDHTDKRALFELLDAEKAAGIALTESCAMLPAASVSGLYFAHPESRYFAVGRIGRDQIESYAQRKQLPVSDVERWLWPYLDYDTQR